MSSSLMEKNYSSALWKCEELFTSPEKNKYRTMRTEKKVGNGDFESATSD